MRYSYSKKLLGEEQRRHRSSHLRSRRLRQLRNVTIFLLSLYAICAINIWRNPRPIHHVWIDEVLVEVIEENWIDHARAALLRAGLACAAILFLARLCFGAQDGDAASSSTAAAPAARVAGDGGGPQGWERGADGYGAMPASAAGGGASTSLSDVSTIAVPAWARRRAAEEAARRPGSGLAPGLDTNAAAAGGAHGAPAAASAASAAAAMESSHDALFDARRPMRTSTELTRFLAQKAAQQQQREAQRRSAQEDTRLRTSAGAGGLLAPAAVSAAGDADGQCREAIRVTYEARPGHRGSGAGDGVLGRGVGGLQAGSPSGALPWAELGIHHLEEGLQRTREWISEVCRRLVEDMDQSDAWFNEHQGEEYDCHHSLSEMVRVAQPAAAGAAAPMARPGGLWGAAGAGTTTATTMTMTAGFGAPAQTVPQFESKREALMRVRERSRLGQQGMQELQTTLRYDQRLALEQRLDVSGTFPSSATAQPSNAELTAMREYVIDRLRTFAKQRSLVSYNPSGGDAETWRSSYPCDAHLLLHVLRYSVKGLEEYVRFGYQTGAHTHDLTLCVGDTGEPYFYVRFRQGSTDTLLSTRQGTTSLMEAVLAFAAVVHKFYHDVYGSIRGTLNLNEAGLLRVVSERARPAWAPARAGEGER